MKPLTFLPFYMNKMPTVHFKFSCNPISMKQGHFSIGHKTTSKAIVQFPVIDITEIKVPVHLEFIATLNNRRACPSSIFTNSKKPIPFSIST